MMETTPAADNPTPNAPMLEESGAGELSTQQIKAELDDVQNFFPIIGIGASAGGLDALEGFFKNVPANSGMAFVIVQHMDPHHKGMLVELLQRGTSLPVLQISDRLVVEPDTIYIIPPNKDLSILHGVLHLFPPMEPRGMRLPIDFFFRSLADDQQECSVGVILTGMGSDGTLGLRAIKEKAGAVFVQSPETAQYDSMPNSAIEAGLADVVAPVEELPGKIIDFLQHIRVLSQPDVPLEMKNQSSLEKVMILLRAQTGHDFSLYKKSTIYRRIERRMGLHQIDRIANYVRFLQENHQETEMLFKELLIGVTSFFRDPMAWERLKSDAIPALLAANPQGAALRAWIPGCSTGEEAYSLGIIFKEVLDQVQPSANFTLQIFATDLDRDAIDKARQGYYPTNIVTDVTSERLNRFFSQEEHGYRVSKEIREMVVFAPHNLVMDAPFTRLDVLICRNLLIYLETELQKKLLPIFHYCLNPGGILFLGSAETIGGYNDLFKGIDLKQRLYRREANLQQTQFIDFPTAFFPDAGAGASRRKQVTRGNQPVINLATLMNQLILKRFAPAAVLTNPQGDILYFSGRTGKYLEPAVGKANLNIFAMAREGLQFELGNAFQQAIRDQAPVTQHNLRVGTNGGTQFVDLAVYPLSEAEDLPGMLLITFTDVDAPVKKAGKGRQSPTLEAQTKQLEQELLRLQGELQSTREQMQTSQEELKSANEELQSTNEELQSTNEELTTSKEEMQSLNEELQTVNQELQVRVDDLARSNNDMKNLLDSTNIATLFLDETLHVRRFTSHASRIIRLISGDTGRPVTDIASDLLYPDLGEDVKEVLRSLIYIEKPVSTRDGNWFTVRIMPYRTIDKRIDGVVITFTDISVAKKLEATLRESEQQTLALFEDMPRAFCLFRSIFDAAGAFTGCRFIFINQSFQEILGLKDAEVTGRSITEVWPGFEAGWIKAMGKVAVSGVSTSFKIGHAVSGKSFNCIVYRPGDNQARFCVIIEEMAEASPDTPA